MKTGTPQAECMITTMKRFNELAVDMLSSVIANGFGLWSTLPCAGRAFGWERPRGVHSDSRIICPPQDECPPRCLAMINRHAHPGEVIVVPFKVRNRSGHAKTYALGVRPLTDMHGVTIAQPTLDQVKIAVQPGLAVTVEMKIELNKAFLPGSTYETDIVIREKSHNQNICFKLHVEAADDIPEAAPFDEQDMDTHFHHWYYHYYCEKPLNRVQGISGVSDERTVVSLEDTKEKEL